MKKHVLICEDDESILEVLQMILEEKGNFQVTAWTYCNSLEPVRAIKPDIVLVDLWFPELGGAELCKQIKEDSSMKHIPVVLISATSDLDKTAQKIGADDYIRKPFNVNEVVEKLQSLIL